MMKKIIIGRGIDCDVVIPDETDIVSRHHLVLNVGFWGRMTLCDTSSNGTFINDKLVKKGEIIPITRKDKVRLGDSWILDWNLVQKPYKGLRISLFVVLFVCGLSLICSGVWYFVSQKNRVVSPQEQTDVLLKDSVCNDITKETPIVKSSLKKSTIQKNKKANKKLKQEMKKEEIPEKDLEQLNDMPIIN